MTKLAPFAIVSTAVLALSACGGADSDNATDTSGTAGSAEVSMADLDGTTYVTEGADALDSSDQSLVAGEPIVLGFEGSNISASAGCNGLGGKADVSAGALEIKGGLIGTEMACADDIMAQERWLEEFLLASPEIAVDGETITLSTDDSTLTLTESESETATPDAPGEDDGVTEMN